MIDTKDPIVSGFEELFRNRNSAELSEEDKLAAYVNAAALVGFALPVEQPAMSPKSKAAALRALAGRVRASAALINYGADDGFRAQDLAAEIEAMAGGDSPRLLASEGRRGYRPNAVRLAVLQIKALEWIEFFAGADVGAAKRQLLVCDAFGTTWAAMARWRGPLQTRFGKAMVAKKLADAFAAGARSLTDWAPEGMEAFYDPWWICAHHGPRTDGMSYLTELGYQPK